MSTRSAQASCTQSQVLLRRARHSTGAKMAHFEALPQDLCGSSRLALVEVAKNPITAVQCHPCPCDRAPLPARARPGASPNVFESFD